jgi:hypothetical protein
MKKAILSLVLMNLCLLSTSCEKQVDTNLPADTTQISYNLTESQNSEKVLKNPNKGIYQHYYDNVNSDAYYGGTEEEIISIPGINHLFIRMARSYMEPKDGVYDFSYIDDLLSTYKKYNIGVSIDITCKETGIKYATPEWLVNKGIGGGCVDGGYGVYKPDYDNEVFLQYLERFHTKMNEYYKDETAIENITMGSIGDWGEGHSAFSGGEYQTYETIKKHIDMYKRCYPNRQIVIGDDYLTQNLSSEEERMNLLQYCYDNNIGMRDDSIMVQYTLEHNDDSVQRPDYFDKLAPIAPTTIECEHYNTMITSGVFEGANGSIKGADHLRNAIRKIKATYFSFHGSIWQWLVDNPDLTKEIANKVGYWYFPTKISAPKEGKRGEKLELSFNVENRGVARAYNEYDLVVKLVNHKNETIEIVTNGKNTSWLPNAVTTSNYTLDIPSNLKADYYNLKVGLRTKLGQQVYFALNDDATDADGFINIGEFILR